MDPERLPFVIRRSSCVIPNRPGQPIEWEKTARSRPQDARLRTQDPGLGARDSGLGTSREPQTFPRRFPLRKPGSIDTLIFYVILGGCITRASLRASAVHQRVLHGPFRTRFQVFRPGRKKNRPAFAGRFYAEGPKCRGRDQNRGRSTAAWRTSMVRQPRSFFDVTSGRSASAAGPALASLNPPVLKLTPKTSYV